MVSQHVESAKPEASQPERDARRRKVRFTPSRAVSPRYVLRTEFHQRSHHTEGFGHPDTSSPHERTNAETQLTGERKLGWGRSSVLANEHVTSLPSLSVVCHVRL